MEERHLRSVSEYYFGKPGQIILALIFAVACLKTAIGLVTSCGETFEKIFPNGPSYRVWAVIFSLLSFLIANVGLDAIIAYSLPVLMFIVSAGSDTYFAYFMRKAVWE